MLVDSCIKFRQVYQKWVSMLIAPHVRSSVPVVCQSLLQSVSIAAVHCSCALQNAHCVPTLPMMQQAWSCNSNCCDADPEVQEDEVEDQSSVFNDDVSSWGSGEEIWGYDTDYYDTEEEEEAMAGVNCNASFL